jgi:hypothetical protein
MEALADQALREMGISEGNNNNKQNYAVIHWRAEKGGMDYLQCTERIVATKKAMETSNRFAHTNMTFVLASSLNMDTSKECGGTFRLAQNTTAPEALAYLMNNYKDHQFRKINQDVLLGRDTEDLIVNSVVDLIVARRVTTFSSCMRTCAKLYRYCLVCNYPGHYTEYIMELRRFALLATNEIGCGRNIGAGRTECQFDMVVVGLDWIH